MRRPRRPLAAIPLHEVDREVDPEPDEENRERDRDHVEFTDRRGGEGVHERPQPAAVRAAPSG